MINKKMKSIATKLKSIIKVARDYEIDAQSQIDGYDYLMWDIEKLLKEIQNDTSN
tara:strand:+ start:541 stop:705 length:165 start_codon:yes stop_codon:yes gene_type:complete